MVIVCAVFQFVLLNVAEALETVPSVSSSDLKSTTTELVGSVVSAMVNDAVPPASVVSVEIM